MPNFIGKTIQMATRAAVPTDTAAASNAVAKSRAEVAVVRDMASEGIPFPGGAVRLADAPMPPPTALPPLLVHRHRLMFSMARAKGGDQNCKHRGSHHDDGRNADRGHRQPRCRAARPFLDPGHPLMPQPVARNGNAQRVACSPSADRVRLSRARHKRHERVVPIEVRDSEIAALVNHGFLAPDRTNDLRAIGDAFGRLLDQMPPERWPMV
jgi:hypothetical protein